MSLPGDTSKHMFMLLFFDFAESKLGVNQKVGVSFSKCYQKVGFPLPPCSYTLG